MFAVDVTAFSQLRPFANTFHLSKKGGHTRGDVSDISCFKQRLTILRLPCPDYGIVPGIQFSLVYSLWRLNIRLYLAQLES